MIIGQVIDFEMYSRVRDEEKVAGHFSGEVLDKIRFSVANYGQPTEKYLVALRDGNLGLPGLQPFSELVYVEIQYIRKVYL